MKKLLTFISLSLVLLLALSACQSPKMNSSTESDAMQTDKKDDMMAQYKRITADEAKSMMSKDAIILDVRTAEEFEMAHIPAALLLAHTDIAKQASALLMDKEQTILVYCRSGNRSETAAKELIAMGYKNVYDFGGINDWTGETVSGKEAGMMDMVNAVPENPAPAFMFTDFDGTTVSLADYEGKQLYIKFWASWCSICKKTLPETDALSAMEKDFEVITVVAPGFSGEKSADSFKAWYADLGYKNITVLLDQDGTYMKEFGVRAFPSAAYIGADGSLTKFTVGHSSSAAIQAVFDEASHM